MAIPFILWKGKVLLPGLIHKLKKLNPLFQNSLPSVAQIKMKFLEFGTLDTNFTYSKVPIYIFVILMKL